MGGFYFYSGEGGGRGRWDIVDKVYTLQGFSWDWVYTNTHTREISCRNVVTFNYVRSMCVCVCVTGCVCMCVCVWMWALFAHDTQFREFWEWRLTIFILASWDFWGFFGWKWLKRVFFPPKIIFNYLLSKEFEWSAWLRWRVCVFVCVSLCVCVYVCVGKGAGASVGAPNTGHWLQQQHSSPRRSRRPGKLGHTHTHPTHNPTHTHTHTCTVTSRVVVCVCVCVCVARTLGLFLLSWKFMLLTKRAGWLMCDECNLCNVLCVIVADVTCLMLCGCNVCNVTWM